MIKSQSKLGVRALSGCGRFLITGLALSLFISSCNLKPALADTDLWKITAYCPCKICTGKYSAYGRFANGEAVHIGGVACNILPFNTKVSIDGLGIYIVKDRGSRRLFDEQKHIDIFFWSHNDAKQFGAQYK